MEYLTSILTQSAFCMCTTATGAVSAQLMSRKTLHGYVVCWSAMDVFVHSSGCFLWTIDTVVCSYLCLTRH